MLRFLFKQMPPDEASTLEAFAYATPNHWGHPLHRWENPQRRRAIISWLGSMIRSPGEALDYMIDEIEKEVQGSGNDDVLSDVCGDYYDQIELLVLKCDATATQLGRALHIGRPLFKLLVSPTNRELGRSIASTFGDSVAMWYTQTGFWEHWSID